MGIPPKSLLNRAPAACSALRRDNDFSLPPPPLIKQRAPASVLDLMSSSNPFFSGNMLAVPGLIIDIIMHAPPFVPSPQTPRFFCSCSSRPSHSSSPRVFLVSIHLYASCAALSSSPPFSSLSPSPPPLSFPYRLLTRPQGFSSRRAPR